jgi:hypothetical protein
MGFRLSVKLLDENDLDGAFEGPFYEDTWDDEEIVELTDLKILDIRLDKSVSSEPEVDPDDPNATYTIEYVDADDSVIETYDNLHYGDNTPTVDGSQLTLIVNEISQPFKEWSPEVSSTVQGNATYKATYHDYPYELGMTFNPYLLSNPYADGGKQVSKTASNANVYIAEGDEYNHSLYENGAIPLSEVNMTFEREDIADFAQQFSAGTVLAVNPNTGAYITKTNSSPAYCSLVYGVFNNSTGEPNNSINSVLRYQGVYAVSMVQGGDSLTSNLSENLFAKDAISRSFTKRILGQYYYITFMVWDMYTYGSGEENVPIENPRGLEEDYEYIGDINNEPVFTNKILGDCLTINGVYHDRITIKAKWNRPVDSQELEASFLTYFAQIEDE